jgi:hypothetical protein
MIPMATLNSPQDDPSIPQPFTRRLFLLQLGISLTGNKAQGQTFDSVGLMLETPVFLHGQLYAVLFRCRRLEDITVQLPGLPIWFTKNIVLQGALLREIGNSY